MSDQCARRTPFFWWGRRFSSPSLVAWILRSRLLGAFIILCLLYTFSRTECPCPKAFSGREVYDPEVHWNVCDFDVAITALVRVLRIRFRVIKQDQRVERPEARGDGDWAVVGDVPKWSLESTTGNPEL